MVQRSVTTQRSNDTAEKTQNVTRDVAPVARRDAQTVKSHQWRRRHDIIYNIKVT